MRRDRAGSVRAWLGSALVHGTVVAIAWLSAVVQPHEPEYVTYEIDFVSPPTEEEELPAPPEEELVVETPDPTPPPAEEPEPEPAPVVEEEPEPVEEEPEEEPPVEEPEPEPAETEAESDPDPEPSADINVRMEGLRKDYPAYYNEVLFHIQRCFRWTGGGRWRAAVDFVINADGTVSGRDIELSTRSGNLSFDLRAVEAIECAGSKFGPLPDDLPYERLPFRMNFSPSGSPPVPEPLRP